MTPPRLIFFPADCTHTIEDEPGLIRILQSAGFISQPLAPCSYQVGNEFLTLLTFLGCAPNISLSPEDGAQFCFVKLPPPTQTAHCLGHTTTVTPACPLCKHKLKNWQTNRHWQHADNIIHCPQCGTESKMKNLRWRHEGGYGRCAVEVTWIHPHEAVPSERLLELLASFCDFDWTYCYANDSISVDN